MSAPYDQSMDTSHSDPFDSNFSVYHNQYGGLFSRLSGPGHFDGMAFWYRPEPVESVYHQHNSPYNRRNSQSAALMEHQTGIKHRRTRSGCFTCRSRRVKCDETRPMCDRCRKGNRECEFPQPTVSKRMRLGDSRGTASEGSPKESKDDTKLDTIDDLSEEEENDDATSGRISPKRLPHKAYLENTRPLTPTRRQRRRDQLVVSTENVSPRSETSESLSGLMTPATATLTPTASHLAKAARWHQLNPEMQKYLQFHLDHMTYYHYFFKLDPTDFIHNRYIDIALSFEPLLYATVAFAAYHHTLQSPDGKFGHFWRYYCRSIELLRNWLAAHSERNEAVLLTILQLVTFEEYLGDWANLATHHRAAQSILVALFNEENIMETETSRCIFDWYIRSDIIMGLIAGNEASLGRSWLAVAYDYHQAKASQEDKQVSDMLASFVAGLRLIGHDMARLFATAEGNPNFLKEVESISERLDEIRQRIEEVNDTQFTATDSDVSISTDGEETFDPRIPLFRDTLWPLNFVWIDWYGIEQMHQYSIFKIQQAALSQQQSRSSDHIGSAGSSSSTTQFPPILAHLSHVQCQIYEAIERSPRAPSGAILGCHASLGLSTVFLDRRDPKYMFWARRKLANVERLGYIWPPNFRQKMAQLWDCPEVQDWWLPDGEGNVKLLQEIRMVVEERNRDIRERGVDDGRGGLREMKAVFENLDLSADSEGASRP